jgi:multidrug efflux system outer membrane protein
MVRRSLMLGGAGLVATLLAGCAVGPAYHRPAISLPADWRSAADSSGGFFDSLRTAQDSLLPPPGAALHLPEAGGPPTGQPGPADTLGPAQPFGSTGMPHPADTLANLQWFDLLQDPVLRQLVETALRDNRDLRAAAAAVEEFAAQAGVARAGFFPQVDLNGRGGKNQVALGSFGATQFDVFASSLDLQWELDVWGRIRRGFQAARADERASEEDRRDVELTVVSAVATAYLELRELDLDLEVSRRTLESRRETVRLARRRFEQGLISELDVQQFESELASSAVAVADFELQVSRQEQRLAVLVGRAPAAIARGRPLAEALAPVEIPPGLPSSLLERRPDIRRAEEQLAAATFRVGAAQSELLPRFTLTAQYGRQSTELSELFDQQNEIYQAIGGVSIPLFTGGRLGKQVDVERARTEQARNQYEQTVLLALEEVQDALADLRTSRDRLTAQARQVDALRRAAELADRRYQNGVSSYLEVLDAERSLFVAEISLAAVERQQLVAAVELYRALGGGWPVTSAEPE